MPTENAALFKADVSPAADGLLHRVGGRHEFASAAVDRRVHHHLHIQYILTNVSSKSRALLYYSSKAHSLELSYLKRVTRLDFSISIQIEPIKG